MDRRALSRRVTNTLQKCTAPDDDDDSMAFPQHNTLKKKTKNKKLYAVAFSRYGMIQASLYVLTLRIEPEVHMMPRVYRKRCCTLNIHQTKFPIEFSKIVKQILSGARKTQKLTVR